MFPRTSSNVSKIDAVLATGCSAMSIHNTPKKQTVYKKSWCCEQYLHPILQGEIFNSFFHGFAISIACWTIARASWIVLEIRWVNFRTFASKFKRKMHEKNVRSRQPMWRWCNVLARLIKFVLNKTKRKLLLRKNETILIYHAERISRNTRTLLIILKKLT